VRVLRALRFAGMTKGIRRRGGHCPPAVPGRRWRAVSALPGLPVGPCARCFRDV